MMQDSAAASHIELSDFYGKNIDLRLLRTTQVSPARIYTHGINTMELHVHGAPPGNAHGGTYQPSCRSRWKWNGPAAQKRPDS